MGSLTRKAQKFIAGKLRQSGVPERELQNCVKKIGRGLLLTSILLIVPLVIIDDVPLAMKIGLQLGYALLMCAGLLLAFDEEKNTR